MSSRGINAMSYRSKSPNYGIKMKAVTHFANIEKVAGQGNIIWWRRDLSLARSVVLASIRGDAQIYEGSWQCTLVIEQSA